MKVFGLRTVLTVSIAMNVAFVSGFAASRFSSQPPTDPTHQTWDSNRSGGIFGEHPNDYELASASIARDLGLGEEQREMLAASWQESELRGRQILHAMEEARLAWWQQMSEPEPERQMLAELESDMTQLMREYRMLRSDRFRAFIETLDDSQRQRVMERMRDRASRLEAQGRHRPPHAGSGRPAGPDHGALPQPRRPHPDAAGDRPIRSGPRDREWDREQMQRRMAEFFENQEHRRHSDLFRRLDAEDRWMPPGRQRPQRPGAERERDFDGNPQARPDPRRRPDLRERNARPEDRPGPPDHRRNRSNQPQEDQQTNPPPEASDTSELPADATEVAD